MLRRPMIFSTTLFLLVRLLDAQTMTMTLPAGYEAVEGNSQTIFPQNTADDQVWHWHYDASNFGNLGPITITDLAIRPKAGNGILAFNFSDWRVRLIEARTNFIVTQHDPVFGQNILRSAEVRSGPWTGGPLLPILPQTVGGFLSMGLTDTFTYDPSTGNDLIVEIRKSGTNLVWGTEIDAVVGASSFVDGNRFGHSTDATASTLDFQNAYFVPIVRISYRSATQTLPRGFENVDGGGAPAFPMTAVGDQKWQWHYDSTQFDASGPISITQIYVRPRNPTDNLAAFSLASLRIILGAATTDYRFVNHATIFAENIEGQKVVRTGAFSGGPVAATGGATSAWVSLDLSEPFVYDPTTGQDFIVEIEKCGAGIPWSVAMDGISLPTGTGGGNRYGHTSSCTSLTQSSASATTDVVPILRIDYEPVTNTFGAVTAFPYREDFDLLAGGTVLPQGWENMVGDGEDAPNDWIVQSGPTPTVSTGPSADHTTGLGNYVYVEDSVSDNPIIAMTSPVFDLSGLAQPRLSFWLHSQNAGVANSLSIGVFVMPNGPFVENVGGVIGATGPLWTERTIDLSPWLNQNVRIQFAVANDNLDFNHDIAIDDVRVYDLTFQSGQSPTAFAALDAAGALEPNGLPVTLGVPGPYEARIFGGEELGLTVSGAPNQPFVLLGGTIAVGSAVYPGIGQLDLDPSQLVVLADGVAGMGLLPGIRLTDASGSYVFAGPNILPPGISFAMQVAVFTGGPSVVALSNALSLESL